MNKIVTLKPIIIIATLATSNFDIKSDCGKCCCCNKKPKEEEKPKEEVEPPVKKKPAGEKNPKITNPKITKPPVKKTQEYIDLETRKQEYNDIIKNINGIIKKYENLCTLDLKKNKYNVDEEFDSIKPKIQDTYAKANTLLTNERKKDKEKRDKYIVSRTSKIVDQLWYILNEYKISETIKDIIEWNDLKQAEKFVNDKQLIYKDFVPRYNLLGEECGVSPRYNYIDILEMYEDIKKQMQKSTEENDIINKINEKNYSDDEKHPTKIIVDNPTYVKKNVKKKIEQLKKKPEFEKKVLDALKNIL